MPGGVCRSAFSTSDAADLEHALLVAEAASAASVERLERVTGGLRAAASNSSTSSSRDLGQVDRLLLDAEAAGVEAREVEQVGRELRQPLDLLAHRARNSRRVSLVEVLVVEQLEKAAEREDRRPQLVRRVRDELPPRVLEAGQPLAHALEGAGELAELVAAASTIGSSNLPARDPLGAPLEPADPAGRRARASDSRAASAAASGDQRRDQEAALDEVDLVERVLERLREEHDVPRVGRSGTAASANSRRSA